MRVWDIGRERGMGESGVEMTDVLLCRESGCGLGERGGEDREYFCVPAPPPPQISSCL
jgi:hypothetical protein